MLKWMKFAPLSVASARAIEAMGRAISLYYGSIPPRRAIAAVVDWVTAYFRDDARVRADLAAAVCRHYPAAQRVFAFTSARGALAACLRSVGVGPGDQVVVSAYTCLAVPTAVIAAGAVPVYVDIDPDTLNVEVGALKDAITPRVRVVILQHTLGKRAPVDAVADICRERGILLIEDCALAVGSRAFGVPLGSHGDAAVISMELSKTLSSGWGGIVVVNDVQLGRALHSVYEQSGEPSRGFAARDMCQTVVSALCHAPTVYARAGKYILAACFKTGLFRPSTAAAELAGRIPTSFIARMAKPQAAFAMRQWLDADRITGRCASNAARIRAALDELRVPVPASPDGDERVSAPRVSFLVNDPADAVDFFRRRGIELGRWFNGPLSPPPQSAVFAYRADAYPNAQAVARRVVNIPCHSRMTDRDVDAAIATLRAYFRRVSASTAHEAGIPSSVEVS